MPDIIVREIHEVCTCGVSLQGVAASSSYKWCPQNIRWALTMGSHIQYTYIELSGQGQSVCGQWNAPKCGKACKFHTPSWSFKMDSSLSMPSEVA